MIQQQQPTNQRGLAPVQLNLVLFIEDMCKISNGNIIKNYTKKAPECLIFFFVFVVIVVVSVVIVIFLSLVEIWSVKAEIYLLVLFLFCSCC